MRSPSFACGFLTHPILAMKNRLLGRPEIQSQGELCILRLKSELPRTNQPQGPIINPGDPVSIGKARLAERSPRHFLRIAELPLADIRHRKMRQLDVVHGETRHRVLPSPRALTEKRQLESELPSILGCEIAGEIPPFGFEIRMREVVAGKFVFPSRQGQRPIRLVRRGGQGAQGEQGDTNKASIHAAPPLPRSSPTPSSARAPRRCPGNARCP